ncbi:discoidin domain-containing protein, partial [Streptomyces sp. NPDC001941]|uniref:discoidin domain-containing protein n=1 Tax=Streptomyces sp. NPDC001941 TaxID=3154659 RepID=UPI0033290278
AEVRRGELDPFLGRVLREARAWTGADRAARPAHEDGAYGTGFGRTRPVRAVTVTAAPGTSGRVEAHVTGQGWRPLGALSPTGWTQLAGRGLRADAVRVADAPGGVRDLVPWYADEPSAEVRPERAELDAEVGGGPRRVDVRLVSRRPDGARGTLTARAPAGITVSAPAHPVVPRGSGSTVALTVKVAPGTASGEYRVPLEYAGGRAVLTVRAYPRTAGPDLARTGTASSSGDETDDFPAAAAADGDPRTRWSSPAGDGAWWETQLAAPARVGQVVLRWQDAYASRYRVMVSADGRTWRTAATVRDGRGGVEAVRLDAPGTRFVRVVADGRATRFGVSLWAAEVYGVAAPTS